MQGILGIYKPQNYTSHDVVAIVRRQSGIKKVGHNGTLDPMATGVLVICVGRATRIIEYLEDDCKEYIAAMKLGYRSDTLDIWGNILEESDPCEVDKITYEDIKRVTKDFKGRITQIPPKYSALKVNGKKLYEYAREGKSVVIKSREVNIREFEILDFEHGELTFRVLCSKGTYIRTICDDIGQRLGVGGVMTALERTKNGIFKAEETVSIENIKAMDKDEIKSLLKPVDYPLNMPSLDLSYNEAKDLINGKKVIFSNSDIFSEPKQVRYKIYYKNLFVGVAVYEPQQELLRAEKILNTEII